VDASIAAAGRALSAGDPLGALKRVALRDDPAALALRGIAMAQLGDLSRARELLRRATRRFAPREAMARARCLAAEAEVALAARDLAWPSRALPEALRVFTARGDRENAAHARLLQARRFLLLGRVEEAEGALARVDLDGASARAAAVAALVAFEIALRRGRAAAAREAVAAAWPGEVPRDVLIERAFGARRSNPSYRARLRVEIGRSRRALWPLAAIRTTHGGFALAPRRGAVRLLAPPVDSPGADVLALLADGERWSTSALALALGSSQRTVQRSLVALEDAGQVRTLGRGRSQRWVSAPMTGFATALLLPGAGPLA
jgi:DNA-binding transcriptional ArsR family regulator